MNSSPMAHRPATLPAPVAKVLDGMMREIQTLRTRVDELDGTTRKDDPETDDPCIGDSR